MIDLTEILNTLILAGVSIAGTLFMAWLRSHLQDQAAATTVGSAVSNALGALQTAAQAAVTARQPKAQLPGVAADLVPGVQYVLDHAGDEAARLGIAPAAIADKIKARIGLAAIQSNIATAASPAPSPAPLAPLPPVPPAVPKVGALP